MTFSLDSIQFDCKEFKGKKVLAVGCTSVELPLRAARHGAKEVLACETAYEAADELRRLASCEGLPIRVLNECLAEIDSADIVLAWRGVDLAALEKHMLKRTIKSLASLPNETLYLKTRVASGLRLESETRHGLEPVLEELKFYFDEVTILKAVNLREANVPCWQIIRASGIRPQGAALSALGQVRSVGIALSPATNAAILVESDKGLLVVKMMAVKSRLARLEATLLNRLCDELSASRPKCLIAPLKLGEEYRIEYRGRHFMVLPFAGDDGEGRVRHDMRLEDLVPAFIAVRRDLRELSGTLIRDLRKAKFFVPTGKSRQLLNGKTLIANHLTGFERRLEELLSLAETAGDADFDALAHGDLQVVNIVVDHGNVMRCVDLDNMALATAYTDILMALAWQGASEGQFGEVCSWVAEEEARRIKRMDFAIAAGLLLRWRAAVEKFSHVPGVDQTVRRWEQGFRNLICSVV
jgi:hypothetical protein